MENTIDIAIDIINKASEKGIRLFMEDEKLKIKVTKNTKPDPEIVKQIKAHKEAIIEFLSGETGNIHEINHEVKSITPFNRNGIKRIPLSFAQERLWFLDQLEGSTAYHLPAILNLEGNLDKEALTTAITEIINRHDVLRSVIKQADGKPFQHILNKNQWEFSDINFSEAENENQLKKSINNFINQPFDLSNDHMLKAALISHNGIRHTLVLVMHHIASDGWSTRILINEMMELYQAAIENRKHQLPELAIQYIDFAVWQRQHLSAELLTKKLGYWKEKLKDVAQLQLPTDYTRPAVQSTKGKTAHTLIDKNIQDQINELSQKEGATLFMTLLSAFKILLYKYTGQKDICVGSPIANRTQKEVEPLVGFFVNTLALITDLSSNLSFIDLIEQVKKTTLDAYSHQEVPFEKIVDEVTTERNPGISPLFQVMLILQNNAETEALSFGNVKVTPQLIEQNTSKLDLAFNLKESKEGLHFGIEYCSDLFSEETIERVMGHFQNLLSAIIQNPNQAISHLTILSENEKLQLIKNFNSTKKEFPGKTNIVSLFEKQVLNYPDHIALVFEEQSYTFKELNTKANQLAHYLKRKGVQKEDLIGLYIERSPEMIISLLAILKSGGAYIPIDTEYPEERINYMIKDARASIIISTSKTKPHEFDSISYILLDKEATEIQKEKEDNPELDIEETNLAYALYTSGSTGKPKGVLIEHKGVVNMVLSHKEVLNIKPETVVLQFASIGFDGATFEIYNTILNGGKLVLSNKEKLTNPEELQQLITKHKIEIAGIPPSLQETMINHLNGLKILVSGGEALKIDVLQSLPKEIKVLNSYGPTENTCCVTLSCNPILSDEKITIGKPIDNVQTYILDSDKNALPIGMTGEIYVGGVQLSRGYLNKPELTNKKFIQNPFSENQKDRLYKTGDLARWLPDGNLEFMGRADDQVKIRGHRIELGEIESILQAHPEVEKCLVLVKEKGNNKQLIAFIVPEKTINTDEIRSYLNAHLPEYMIPFLFVELDSFLLTPNGKIDKKSLLNLDNSLKTKDQFVAPQSKIEKALANIWSDLLRVEKISIYDNFFKLGGDSIITIQLVSRAKKAGYHLKAKDIFQHQTIATLAKVIKSNSEATLAEQGKLTGKTPLLPIQQWFFEKEFKGRNLFNQAILLQIEKIIPEEFLKQTIHSISQQHDALRFVYTLENGHWSQSYESDNSLLKTIDLTQVVPEDFTTEVTRVCAHFQQSLNIESGEIFKAIYIKTPESEEQNRLFLVVHHLAIDGVSWRIILEQIENCLSSLAQNGTINLGLKSSSYRQWANELIKYSTSENIKDQITYWSNTFNNWSPLPVDFQTEYITMNDVEKYTVSLDQKLTHQLLQSVHQAYGTEINDLLIAALAKTISDFNDNPKTVIGLEGHGREEFFKNIDLSQTVGWFTNLYPVAISLEKDYSEADLIKSVKEQLRQIPQKGIGYGILKYLDPDEKIRQEFANQKWDILFNYLGQFDNAISDEKGLQLATEAIGESISPDYPFENKLEINSSISAGQLRLAWSYSPKQFRNSTIEMLSQSFINHLSLLIEHCSKNTETHKTPSDYSLQNEIGFKELDLFLNEHENEFKRKEQISSIYPLSPLQEGMLFHALYDGHSASYIEQFVFDFPEGLNIEAFKSCWESLFKNHSILRTAFYNEVFSIPVQVVYENVTIPFEILDYSAFSEKEQQLKVTDFSELDREKGFDFINPPLMRISLIQLSSSHFKMVWTSHHLIMDGWSLPVMMSEILSNYEALIEAEKLNIQDEDLYEDYIKHIQSKDKYEAQSFWKKYMDGLESSTLLPFARNSKDRNKGGDDSKDLKLILDSKQTEKLKAYAQENHLTVNTIIQGIWSVLLSKYTGNNEIVFGATVSGRPSELKNAEERIGLYINTIPIHASINQHQAITEWFLNLQKGQTQAREYQYTSLNEIQRLTDIKGDLFDSLLVFENYPVGEVLSKDWVLKIGDVQIKEQTNYLLTLIAGLGENLSLKFSYNSSLLKEEIVVQIKNHFENTVNQLLQKKVNAISELNILSAEEEKELLDLGDNSRVGWPKEETLVSLFEKQVIKTPNNIAITFEGLYLTYQELNAKANQWAHTLIELEVQPDSLVGICLDRSAEMIIGILAILKAGGAYVPIDPNYPQDRIIYTVEDSGLQVVLTSNNCKQLFADQQQLNILDLDEIENIKATTENPEVVVKPGNLAYVIYTSGTTGKPKGVLLEHRKVVRLFETEAPLYDFKESDVWTMFHSFCFDFSVWEMYGALLYGGRLVVIPKQMAKDTLTFAELIQKEKVTILNQTPSAFYTLQEQLLYNNIDHSLRHVIFGGEKLNPVQLKEWIKRYPACKMVNMYGITETTVHVTYKEISAQDTEQNTSNIGKPIPTLSCFILDEDKNLLPKGVVGELYVGGEGVARGYLNRPELTNDRFMEHPLAGKGKKLYRTGDLAKWLPNGELEYLGRADDQVKIRGFRIELGEIESVLKQVEGISQSVVLAKSLAKNHMEENNLQLVAWLVPNENYDKESTILYLKSKLPEHMVPSFLLEVEKIPLTSNGKINKKALPDPISITHDQQEYIAPKNDLEKSLANIWQQLLKIEAIGIHEDFFELGGHSLLATRVVSAIRKELNTDIAIRDLFENPTIAALAQMISDKGNSIHLPEITPQKRPEKIPLSYAQERIWVIDQLEGSSHYHMPAVLKLKGELDRECLEYAFKETIQRHEVLRTVLKEDDGQLFQAVREVNNWSLHYSEATNEAEEDAIHEFVHEAFDLKTDVMLRAKLCKVAANEHILVMVLHHVASDGWSISILIKELVELYLAKKQNQTPEILTLPLQYADYALWQQQYLKGEIMEKKLAFWKEKLADTEVLELPNDEGQISDEDQLTNSIEFALDKNDSQQLNKIAKEENATLFMVLLAAFKILLHKYSKQQDICIGSPIANRNQKEIEHLIGFFLNTLALRSEVDGSMNFKSLLSQIRTNTLDAYAHQEVPFEKVLEAVNPERIPNKTPLFQVFFNLQNQPQELIDLEGLTIEQLPSKVEASKFDITLYISENDKGLKGLFVYNNQLFTAKRMERMVTDFTTLIKDIINNPMKNIKEFNFLSESEQDEQQQELMDFFGDF